MMIRQLPQELRSRLRSGVTITHLTQCVEELVMNSLDAGANCVAVRVDLTCFKIQVVDNGTGISPEQLEVIGNRYFTSKCHEIEDLQNLHYFGYRGEALASLKDMAAIVEVNTRTRQSSQTYCKMFQRGIALKVFESTIHRPSAGTTISVHDIFYNLPVRRKTMVDSLELERIRHRIEGIALIHPNMSFSLRNDVTGHVILQTHKSSCMLTAFTYLFGTGKAKSLCPVSVSQNGFYVEGYIGKEPHYKKELQFIYINGRLVLKTKIHKLISQVLSKSLLFKRKLLMSECEPSGNSSPTKQNERYSIFVLNIKCPLDIYDITFDPAKTLVEFKDWDTLTSLIESLVWNFLKKENLVSLADSNCLVLSNEKSADEKEKDHNETQVSDADVSEEVGNNNGGLQSEGCGIEMVEDTLSETCRHEGKTKTFIENIGDRISTHNMLQGLHSKMVSRSNNLKTVEETILNNNGLNSSQLDIVNNDQTDVISIHSGSTEDNISTTPQDEVKTTPATSEDGARSSERDITSDLRSKSFESSVVETGAAEAVVDDDSNNMSSSCVETPDGPTVHVCISPKLTELSSTKPSQIEDILESTENNEISLCNSDMVEDPLLSPLKGLCNKESGQMDKSNRSSDDNGANGNKELHQEKKTTVKMFKEHIRLSLGQLYAHRAATDRNNISRITLTPEKKKPARSFRQQISESLAAGGFIDPVSNTESASKVSAKVVQFRLSVPKPDLISDLPRKSNTCQGGAINSQSSVEYMDVEVDAECSQKEDYNETTCRSRCLKLAENPVYLSVPSYCNTKQNSKQLNKSQTVPKTYNRCLKTVITQTSPKLNMQGLESFSRQRDFESNLRKRLNPISVSVASKLSKLVQTNAHKKTKENSSREKEKCRSRFMTSASFFETPRTVFARLSAQGGTQATVETETGRFEQYPDDRLHTDGSMAVRCQSDNVEVQFMGSSQLASKAEGNGRTEQCHVVKLHTEGSRKTGCHSDDVEVQFKENNQLTSQPQHGTHTSINKTQHRGDGIVCTDSSDEHSHEDILFLNKEQLYNKSADSRMVARSSQDNSCGSSLTGLGGSVNNEQSLELEDTIHKLYQFQETDTDGEQMGKSCESLTVPEASQGFNITDISMETVGPPKSPAFHSEGFRLTQVESQVGEFDCVKSNSECRYTYETQEFSPLKGTSDSDKDECSYETQKFSPLKGKSNRDSYETQEFSPLEGTSNKDVCAYGAQQLSPLKDIRDIDVCTYEAQELFPLKEMSDRHACISEAQELSPLKSTYDRDICILEKRKSLFSGIFTPVKSVSVGKYFISPSPTETNDSHKPVLADQLVSSDIPCAQKPVLADQLMSSEIPCAQKPVLADQLMSSDIPCAQKPVLADQLMSSEIPCAQKPVLADQLMSSEIPCAQKPVLADQLMSSDIPCVQKPVLADQLVSSDIPCAQKPVLADQLMSSEIPCAQKPVLADQLMSSDIPCVQKPVLADQLMSSDIPCAQKPVSADQLMSSDIPCAQKPVLADQLMSSDIPCVQKPVLAGQLMSSEIPCAQKPVLADQLMSSDIPCAQKPVLADQLMSSEIPCAQKPVLADQLMSSEIPCAQKPVLADQLMSSDIPCAQKPVLADQLMSSEIPCAQKPVLADQLMSSDIPCAQKPVFGQSDADCCEYTETSPLLSLLSRHSDSSQSVNIYDEQHTRINDDLTRSPVVLAHNVTSDIMDDSIISKPHTQTNTSAENQTHIIPLLSSSDRISSSDVEFRQHIPTDRNVAETNDIEIIESEQVFGNNNSEEDCLNSSVTQPAEQDLNATVKNSTLFSKDNSEMWSPDSFLDSADTTEVTGSNDSPKVKTSSPSPAAPNSACHSPYSTMEQTQEKWKKVKDPKTGSTLYVNILTGNTMSESDWLALILQDTDEPVPNTSANSGAIVPLSAEEKQKLQEMMTSHLDACSGDRGVKWRSASDWELSESSDISSLLSTWSNPVFEKPKQVALNAEVHHDTMSAARCFQSLYPIRFTKRMLHDVKVLGQIDNKFIACVLKTDDKNTSQVPNLIVLVDQHAAHERIRLEQLTDDLYIDDDEDGCSIKQSQVTPPKTLSVTDEEMRLLKSFRAEINRIGITFTCNSTSRNEVNIHSVPACIVEREANELKRKRDSVAMEMVEVLLKDHIQLLKNTGGARSQLPQSLHKVLCSQACHGAVKFGDSLTFEQCVELIENLSACSLPFQCAHGRPSVTPLIDLHHLKTKLPPERIRRPNLWKISRNLDIHQ